MRGERARGCDVSTFDIFQSYETHHGEGGHLSELSDNSVLALAIVLLVCARLSARITDHLEVNVLIGVVLVVVLVAVGAIRKKNRFFAATMICFAISGVLLGTHSWHQLEQPQLGPFQGAAKVVEDPQWRNGGVQTVLQVEGERFIVYAYGLPGRRLSNRRAGEVVSVSGDRLRLEANKRYRLSYRHIVGTFAVRDVSESYGNG